MKNIIKDNRGFSLVELLGVMVILIIILSMGMTAYSRYKKRSTEKSYELMSKNARSAAEEYFMDNLGAKEVSLQTLVDKNYLAPTIDPMFKKLTCSGYVRIFDTKKETQDSLELNTYKVVIECKKHKSCDLYPSNLDCDAEGGLVTDGSTNAYNLGLANYSFGNTMSMAIRVKFNEFIEDNYMEYFGNWEVAGGGFGLTKTNHDFYYNLYSDSAGAYYSAQSSVEAKLNTWYVVVGVLEPAADGSSTIKLYIDGQLKGTGTLPGGVVRQSTMNIMVGGNPEANGSLLVPTPISASNALVFDRALTEQEISNYFSTPNLPINYNQSDPSLLANMTF